MPKRNHQSDRRRYIRLDSVFPIEVYLKSSNKDNRPRMIQGFTRDVSLGGLCLSVNDPAPELLSCMAIGADPLEVVINLPLGNAVHARVRVAWHEIKQLARHRQLLAGVSYSDIGENDKMSVVDAARRIKYLPMAGGVAAILLAILLSVSNFQTSQLRAKNEDLIRRFHEVREEGSLYAKSAARMGEKYEAISAAIAEKKAREAALSLQLGSLKIDDPANLAAERARIESAITALAGERASLEGSLKGISERMSKAGRLLDEAKRRKGPVEEATLKNMLQWIRTHRNRFTGLVMSYEGDPSIRDWAFTYDQSLASQVFMISGDVREAAQILQFFRDRAQRRQGGFVNAYNSRSGTPSEETVHMGPNIWIGIAAAQFSERTGDRAFLGLAEEVASWVISQKDKEGGLPGGPGIKWYSTEHNIDAYALFKMLYAATHKETYLKEMNSTFRWIKENTYSGQEKRMNRGKGDSTIATDTLAWSIAAIGPATLAREGMDPDSIIKFAEDHCLVTTYFNRTETDAVEVRGFDFARAQNLARRGVVSTEWTAQMVIAFKMMAGYYLQMKDTARADGYASKAEFYLGELEKMVISSPSPSGQGAGCLPYASQPNADTGHGWRTPSGTQTGSVSGTAYTIFAKRGYNPLGTE